ncbi:MAG: hypothetical protein ACLFU9_03925 [Candidatus Bathyarchaeia archaeon]
MSIREVHGYQRKQSLYHFLPEKQKFWIEYTVKNPQETFGFEKAEITYVDNVLYPKKDGFTPLSQNGFES